MRTSLDFHLAAHAAPPPFPAPVAAASLDRAERHRLASDVAAAIAGSLLPSDRHEKLTDQLTESFAISQRERTESRTILAVDGAFGVGKTAAILRWAYLIHRDHAGDIRPGENQPSRVLLEGGRCDDVPVVWLGLKGGQDAGGISVKMLHFLRHGYRGNAQQREIAVGEALKAHRPKLVVVDDAHMLNTRLIKGRQTLDSIKSLNDMLSDIGGTMLLVGQGLVGGELLSDPQLATRLETPLSLAAYATSTKPEIAEWQRLIKACENLLRPYLAPDDPHPLRQHDQRLWHLSHGHVRDLSRLLAAATATCIREGRAEIAASDFERVRPLVRVQQAHHSEELRLGQRKGGRPRAT
jgi:hypothetical protein